MSNFYSIIITVVIAFITAIIGYWVGSIKYFKEYLFKMYGEILPIIIDFVFCPQKENEAKFNAALSQSLLYASRNVSLKIDKVIELRGKNSDDFVHAFQEAIAEMRKDVQPLWRFRKRVLKVHEVKHFCIRSDHSN